MDLIYGLSGVRMNCYLKGSVQNIVQTVFLQKKLKDHRRPADIYIEGSDQYRGWFNSSLSTAVAITGKSPYKNIVSHGMVLDGNGRKMSKSIGNTMEPGDIQRQMGADILRLWV